MCVWGEGGYFYLAVGLIEMRLMIIHQMRFKSKTIS